MPWRRRDTEKETLRHTVLESWVKFLGQWKIMITLPTEKYSKKNSAAQKLSKFKKQKMLLILKITEKPNSGKPFWTYLPGKDIKEYKTVDTKFQLATFKENSQRIRFQAESR